MPPQTKAQNLSLRNEIQSRAALVSPFSFQPTTERDVTVIFFSLVLDLDVDYLHFSPTGQALRANLSARDRRGFEPVAALRFRCNAMIRRGSKVGEETSLSS